MFAYEKPVVNLGPRVAIAIGISFAFFFILAVRLWYLQILRGDHFRTLSENNRRQVIYIPPPRGLILDRNGEVLVKNKPAFNVEFITEDSPDQKETLASLAALLDTDPKELQKRLKNQRKRRRFEPKILYKDVSRDTVAQVVSRMHSLPGVIITHYPARQYLFGSLGSHALGYIREISGDQLKMPGYDGYRLGDLVGQYGLERRWEPYLQGNRGTREVVVNARSVRIGELSFEPETAGRNIILTIDKDTQQAADQALSEKKGAIVAVDPNTGKVLAMASSPNFDPNIFTGELDRKVWQGLVTSADKPMNNRSVQGVYPPGSVFKAIMATAGLAEGVISKHEHIKCPGYYHFKGRNYHCHKRSGHGAVNLDGALIQSCDVYFYIVGQRLGVDRIHDYATRFGLGSQTGLELVQEMPGLVPSTEWKRKRYKGTGEEKWWAGETLSVAIGQGALEVTPLQMAMAVAAVLNGGKVYTPYLVEAYTSHTGQILDDEFPAEVRGTLEVDPGILKQVKRGLNGVVNDVRGTGKRAKLPEEWGILVGGKTGTSQVVSLSKKTDDKRFEHHAWFVGYAPIEKPEIVVSAIIENGGHGGVAAAPAVREVLEAYFENKVAA